MTREQAIKDQAAFNAFCAGLRIQEKYIGSNNAWYDIENPCWIAEVHEHRIHPDDVDKVRKPLFDTDQIAAIIRENEALKEQLEKAPAPNTDQLRQDIKDFFAAIYASSNQSDWDICEKAVVLAKALEAHINGDVHSVSTDAAPETL